MATEKLIRASDARAAILRADPKLAYCIDNIKGVDAVELPCKVGDTVWIVGDKFPAEIDRIIVDKDGICFEYAEYDRGYELTELWDDGTFTLYDIGKTVFLTQEEAEAALAKMDGGNEDG